MSEKTKTELWTSTIQHVALVVLLVLLVLAFGMKVHIPGPIHEGLIWAVLAALGIPRATEVMQKEPVG